MSMSGLHLRLSGKCYQDLLYLSNPLTSDHSFLTSEQLNHTPGSCFSTVSLGHTFPSSNIGNWRRTEAMNFLWHTPLFTAFFAFLPLILQLVSAVWTGSSSSGSHLVLPMWSNVAQGLNHVIQMSDTASQPLLIKNSHDPKGDLPGELYVERHLQ